MKRAALYARVSTDRQREDETIEAQLAAVTERIAADGNEILEQNRYLEDGYTGDLLRRPELDRLRENAKRGDFDVLYVYDRGRLSREYAYQELVIEELRDRGIEFVTLHDMKAETPEEQVMQGMQGLFHEYE